MPQQSDKRKEYKRNRDLQKAHNTAYVEPTPKPNDVRRSDPGRKAPARGIARYPWATAIILCLVIAAVIGGMAKAHAGPFAPPVHTVAKPKSTPAPAATPASTPAAAPTSASQSTANASSPCLGKAILSAITDTAVAPSAAQIKAINHTYSGAQNVIDDSKLYCVGINTTKGLIVAELDPKIAPKTVNNFVFLAQNHFYDGLTFHRVVQGFVAQGGDPTGTGSGGPGYKFNDEPVQGNYTIGTIAMANSGPNTNGSQFFIDIADNTTTLQKQYNLFGHVVQGLNVAQSLTITGGSAKPDVMNHVIVKAAS
ncbi:peptidylprolyl isomerase [Ktedonobacteria bacterium brp13]|nr:peptidylprolyl isomerase [Ktedonobacteria bacterium brp13]